MAHIGQELALGPVCSFGGLLGMMQFLLGAFALSDVTEDDDSADDFMVFITDRCGDVFDRKTGPIFSPKYFIADPAWIAILERRIKWDTRVADMLRRQPWNDASSRALACRLVRRVPIRASSLQRGFQR